jgi:hypothetical protein
MFEAIVGFSTLAVYCLLLSCVGYRMNRTKSEQELRWIKDPSFPNEPHGGVGGGAAVVAIRYPRQCLIVGCSSLLVAVVIAVWDAIS